MTRGQETAAPLHWLYDVADPVRLAILRHLSEVDEATISDLARSVETSAPTLRRHLEALVAAGHAKERAGESDGETPGRPAARFFLSRAVRESVRAVLPLDF